MIFLLNTLAICKIYNITNQTMKTLTLQSDDELILNTTKSDYFIHVQNHFFYGTLEINIFNTTTNKYSKMKGMPQDRLRFTQCSLHIRYSSKSSFCRISFWIIGQHICEKDSLHYSGMTSAQLEIFNYTEPFTACYFFESSTKPKITSDKPIRFDSRLYFISDNETLVEKLIEDNISDLIISELSILRDNHNVHNSIMHHFSLTTDLKFSDFTDKNAYFKNCKNGVCETRNITVPEFVVKRKVVWWIWLTIYIIPSLLLTLGISLILIAKKKETSLFTTSKPLISEASKASLLSLF